MRIPLPFFDNNNWIGVIGDDFTTAQVAKAVGAVGQFMIEKKLKSILLGYDTRFGGRMYANVAHEIFSSLGIRVAISSTPITSPCLIFNMVKQNYELGMMVTASSHPAEYSGLKLKGISSKNDIEIINKYILEDNENDHYRASESLKVKALDMNQPYLQYIRSTINIELIKESDKIIAFDAMYGASQYFLENLLPASIKVRSELNPSFKGIVPNPTPEELTILLSVIMGTEYTMGGFATNSDGEVLAICDENGKFFDTRNLLKDQKNIPWRDALFVALKTIEIALQRGQKLSEII